MPRVSEEYYENKRSEIIEAAFRVCTRKPITSVVMQDVIDETGFSHGVIYKYYKDLDDVLKDLVVLINSNNRIDNKLKKILNSTGTGNWNLAIRKLCKMLAKHMKETGTDTLKISLYCDMLAICEPDRVGRIAKNIDKNSVSTILVFEKEVTEYLETVVKENDLHPRKSVEEIMQFIIVNYHGIQTGYVLSESYDARHIKNKYKPQDMFDCLADSVIALLEGESK